MIHIKKTAQKKGPPEARKLALNKETIKDLTPRRAEEVRGGQNKEDTKYCQGTGGGNPDI